MTASEMMEQGIRAYTRGQLGEAERCWREVVALDPTNARAQSYLELLLGKLVRPAPAPQAAPVSLPPQTPPPAPSSAPPAAIASGAKPGAAWMEPPLEPTPGASPTASGGPASCWDSGADEITTPITNAEPLPEPEPPPGRAAPSEYAPSPWDHGPASAPAIVLDEGVGLDLAMVAEQSGLRSLVPEEAVPETAGRAARSEVEIGMEGARELFALGDFSGSLEMIEKILKIDPSHEEAREYLKQNEATLIAMYESKLGPPHAVPRLAIKPEEVMWLNLDHRAGFLLAQIDGTVSYEDLFALSGLPRLDTARILAMLLQENVIRS